MDRKAIIYWAVELLPENSVASILMKKSSIFVSTAAASASVPNASFTVVVRLFRQTQGS
jgi:hypothetical protein